MTKRKWMMLLIPAIMLLNACSTNSTIEPTNEVKATEETVEEGFVADYDWPLAYFEAVNQNEEEVTLQDFHGEVWLMNMIFTNCTTVCLPMTYNMAQLQKMLSEENLNIPLVSLSVDPLQDTPETLKEYGEQYEADFSNWSFLTGYSEEEIQKIAKSVKTLVEKQEGTDQVTHSTKFFLINKNGVAVKGYDGVNPPNEEIIADMKALQ